MVYLKIMIALCAAATVMHSTAASVLPPNEMAYTQIIVTNSFPNSAVQYTTAVQPAQDPAAPSQTRSYSAVVAKVAAITPVASAVPVVVPAATPCQIVMKEMTPTTSMQASTAPALGVDSAATASSTMSTPVTETVTQPTAIANVAQPLPVPVPSNDPVEAAATIEPLATEPTVTAATPTPTDAASVATETPTMVPVVTIAQPDVNKPSNSTMIGGIGRLKLGLNVTVDGDGNVSLGVKGKFKGNGTVVTKTGDQYNAGGQFEGGADVDTGINIGPMPNGGAKYSGGLDVGGNFEVEKPPTPSVSSATSETTLAASNVRANDEVALTLTTTEAPGALPNPLAETPVAEVVDSSARSIVGRDVSVGTDETGDLPTPSAL